MPCPDCFRGGTTPEQPTGTVTTIHGLPTYVARPPGDVTPRGLVVFIPDAFGWDCANSRVLSDHYASKACCLVYLPDFMNGSAVPVSLMDSVDYILEPAPSWLSLLAKPLSVVRVLVHALPFLVYARAEATWPVVLRFFQDLRTSPLPFDTSDLRIGAAGFCWGGRHVMALARDDPDTCAVRYGETVPRALVDCVFTAHPSNLHVPDDAENVRVPTSVVVGDIDAILRSGPARVMKSVLDKKDGHEMVILPGARHGFATRAGRGDGHARECAQRAEDQAVAWFLRAFNAGGA